MGSTSSPSGPAVPLRVGSKWRLNRKVGSGSFGEVYLGNSITDGREVAIKIEPAGRKNPHLLYEAKLMRHLDGGVGIPTIFHYGLEGDWTVMVMDLLGPSLEDFFTHCGRKFSLKTTLMLVDMMLQRIEFVHSRSIIHRDIKPHNFLMGRGKTDRLVFVIDFGLAKRYRDAKTLEHIPYRDGKNLTGTARYVSINTHVGVEQSRRDDLESLAYVFLYFINGTLPWQGLKATSKKDKYEKIMEIKMHTSIDTLCHNAPKEFGDFLMYCRLLKFWERPDYQRCRRLFKDLFFRERMIYDFGFDWLPSATSTPTNNSEDPSPPAAQRPAQPPPRVNQPVKHDDGDERDDPAALARTFQPRHGRQTTSTTGTPAIYNGGRANDSLYNNQSRQPTPGHHHPTSSVTMATTTKRRQPQHHHRPAQSPPVGNSVATAEFTEVAIDRIPLTTATGPGIKSTGVTAPATTTVNGPGVVVARSAANEAIAYAYKLTDQTLYNNVSASRMH